MGESEGGWGEDFSAHVEREGETLRVTLRGDASGDALAPLDQLIESVHTTVVSADMAEAAVDIRELEFMSMVCFKSLLTWVTRIQEESKQYHLRFISNPNIPWQRRSLKSLSCFAVDLVKVEASGVDDLS